MLSQDELYCIATYLPCREFINFISTNYYNYHYFKHMWEYLIKRDFKFIKSISFNHIEHYKKIYKSKCIAKQTLLLFDEIYRENQNSYKIYIHPLRNINRYNWLPKFFNNIVKYEPTIILKIHDIYTITLIKHDYELFEYVDLSKDNMIKTLTKLFYYDPYIKFVTYNNVYDEKLNGNFKYRIDILN